MNRFFRHIATSLLAATGLLLAGCSMMHPDLKDCPTGLYVRFVYDYNTQRADMFKDHVGHVKLYVYDEQGRKVAEREVSNTDTDRPLKQYGYAIHFENGELPDGRYRLQAVAMQRDWEGALATKGAKYRRNVPETHTDLKVTLDHPAEKHPVTGRHHVDASAPLDTLWHTLKVMSYEPMDGDQVPGLQETSKPYSVYPLEEQYVTVKDGYATYATVSLVRDTKHLNVSIRQLDDPSEVAHTDFDVTITDDNAEVGHDNELTSDHPLLYAPYTAWTSTFNQGGITRAGDDTYRTAYYNMMFNRLVYDEKDLDGNARLRIVNRENGAVVADVNLTATLAQGRQAYAQYAYSHQEYLDREYEYRLDFILKGDKWLYCDVVINVLSWSKRIQNESL